MTWCYKVMWEVVRNSTCHSPENMNRRYTIEVEIWLIFYFAALHYWLQKDYESRHIKNYVYHDLLISYPNFFFRYINLESLKICIISMKVMSSEDLLKSRLKLISESSLRDFSLKYFHLMTIKFNKIFQCTFFRFRCLHCQN